MFLHIACSFFFRLSLNSHDEKETVDEEDNIMHSHNSHQRFYHYAGPPSIVMGTWGDRSRSQFAPPPAPFAIPPAGVPGGRLGPAPNRINAGYHSLQYTPVTAHVDYGKVLEKKNANNSSKHHHHGSHRHERHDHYQVHQVAQPNLAGSGDHQQLHKLPQVMNIFFTNMK